MQQSAPQSMCLHCRGGNHPQAMVCQWCGNPLKATTLSAPPPAPTVYVPVPQSQPSSSSPWLTGLIGVLGGATGFIIVAVISVILLFGGCMLCFTSFTSGLGH
jgi:hypothetical protein